MRFDLFLRIRGTPARRTQRSAVYADTLAESHSPTASATAAPGWSNTISCAAIRMSPNPRSCSCRRSAHDAHPARPRHHSAAAASPGARRRARSPRSTCCPPGARDRVGRGFSPLEYATFGADMAESRAAGRRKPRRAAGVVPARPGHAPRCPLHAARPRHRAPCRTAPASAAWTAAVSPETFDWRRRSSWAVLAGRSNRGSWSNRTCNATARPGRMRLRRASA